MLEYYRDTVVASSITILKREDRGVKPHEKSSDLRRASGI
jgi:hypothetical protein